jgi:endonuclease YncB( thermonuclease family)
MIRNACFIAIVLAQPALAETITGTAHAGDGDSFRVGARRIRLYGIDAPEFRQTCQVRFSNWSCGVDAAAALSKLIDDQPIMCESRDRDVYGRTVATCLVDRQDVAARMVGQGFAVVLDNGQAEYAAYEARAKAKKAGIWASTFQMPAEYRKANPREPSPNEAANTGQWSAPVRALPQRSRYMYQNCAQARFAGAAPMYRGQPGYNPNLDGDNDGISCEPYRGQR